MCATIPFSMPTGKACSNKCCGGCQGATKAPRVSVLASCNGMVDIFEKEGACFKNRRANSERSFFLPEELSEWAERREASHAFDQLILIGAPHDNAWVHALLPEKAALRVVAEIPYPLLPVWMSEPDLGILKDVVGKLCP